MSTISDDADARAQVAEVITAGGLGALDAGSLQRARGLEALGFLQVTRPRRGRSLDGRFAVVA